jgi:hypothetical protein
MNKAATETLDGIIVVKRRSLTKRKQNLCLDKGYDFPEVYNMRLLIEDIYHLIYVNNSNNSEQNFNHIEPLKD